MILKSTEAVSYDDTNGHLINGSVVLNGDERERLLHASAGSNGAMGTTSNGATDLSLEDILFQEQELSMSPKSLGGFRFISIAHHI